MNQTEWWNLPKTQMMNLNLQRLWSTLVICSIRKDRCGMWGLFMHPCCYLQSVIGWKVNKVITLCITILFNTLNMSRNVPTWELCNPDLFCLVSGFGFEVRKFYIEEVNTRITKSGSNSRLAHRVHQGWIYKITQLFPMLHASLFTFTSFALAKHTKSIPTCIVSNVTVSTAMASKGFWTPTPTL